MAEIDVGNNKVKGMSVKNVYTPYRTRISIANLSVKMPTESDMLKVKKWNPGFRNNPAKGFMSLGLTKLGGGHAWNEEVIEDVVTKTNKKGIFEKTTTRERLVLTSSQVEYNKAIEMLTGGKASTPQEDVRGVIRGKRYNVIIEEWMQNSEGTQIKRVRYGTGVVRVISEQLSREEAFTVRISITFTKKSVKEVQIADPEPEVVIPPGDGEEPNPDYWSDTDLDGDNTDADTEDLTTVNPKGKPNKVLKKYSWVEGEYYTCYQIQDSRGLQDDELFCSPGRMVFSPYVVDRDINISKIEVDYWNSTDKKVAVGIYDSNVYGMPRNLIHVIDAGATGVAEDDSPFPGREFNSPQTTIQSSWRYTSRNVNKTMRGGRVYWIALRSMEEEGDIALRNFKLTHPIISPMTLMHNNMQLEDATMITPCFTVLPSAPSLAVGAKLVYGTLPLSIKKDDWSWGEIDITETDLLGVSLITGIKPNKLKTGYFFSTGVIGRGNYVDDIVPSDGWGEWK